MLAASASKPAVRQETRKGCHGRKLPTRRASRNSSRRGRLSGRTASTGSRTLPTEKFELVKFPRTTCLRSIWTRSRTAPRRMCYGDQAPTLYFFLRAVQRRHVPPDGTRRPPNEERSATGLPSRKHYSGG